ncbi:MAG TPA: hypothetical protein VHA33_30735 [Candidatus Angelobacter sp.]|jgi:hypothetical protein|nr:hypothetical protein [Candidatus Angelobacter sp.]
MIKFGFRVVWAFLMVAGSVSAWAQTCQVRDEIPDPVKSAVENSAQQIFEQAGRGDAATVRANSITALQSNFNGIAAAITDNKAAFAGAKPQIRNTFLMETGPNPSADGRFYCGVFEANGMSASSAAFDLPGLPVGKYSIVIQDFIGSRGPYSLTTIFQDQNGWKLAGFYVRPQSALGHDGIWFLEHARDYKSKGQTHNSWFYYSTSWELLAPVTFMDTRLLSKIIQESTNIQPKDIPAGGKPVTYSANGKTYNITDISVFRLANTFDLNIKYSVPSTADFNATQADARQLASAYIAQYPELKDTFNNVYAHAVDASGGDVVGLVTLKAAK